MVRAGAEGRALHYTNTISLGLDCWHSGEGENYEQRGRKIGGSWAMGIWEHVGDYALVERASLDFVDDRSRSI